MNAIIKVIVWPYSATKPLPEQMPWWKRAWHYERLHPKPMANFVLYVAAAGVVIVICFWIVVLWLFGIHLHSLNWGLVGKADLVQLAFLFLLGLLDTFLSLTLFGIALFRYQFVQNLTERTQP